MSIEELKILVIEDYKPMQLVLKHQLCKLGIKNIQCALSHTEGWTALTETAYDVIISDWGEPNTFCAKDTFSEMGNLRPGKPPHFILMVETLNESVKKEAQDTGIYTFLEKPFTVEDIRTLLEAQTNIKMVG